MKTWLMLLVAFQMTASTVVRAGENKETETLFGVTAEKEHIQIGLALSEVAAVWLLGPGKQKPAISKQQLEALAKARTEFDMAQNLVTDARKAEMLGKNLEKTAEASKLIGELNKDAAKNAKAISEQSKILEQLAKQHGEINALNTVTKEFRAETIKKASDSFRKATDAVIESGKNAKAIAKGSKTLKVVKVAGRVFALTDLGIKGYCWVVLETDPGYSPAGEMVYRGGRNLYERAKPMVTGEKPTHK